MKLKDRAIPCMKSAAYEFERTSRREDEHSLYFYNDLRQKHQRLSDALGRFCFMNV